MYIYIYVWNQIGLTKIYPGLHSNNHITHDTHLHRFVIQEDGNRMNDDTKYDGGDFWNNSFEWYLFKNNYKINTQKVFICYLVNRCTIIRISKPQN